MKNPKKFFKKQTSEKKEFSRCFQNELPMFKEIENGKKVLKNKIQSSFKKIRIKSSSKMILHPGMSILIDQRNKLMKKGG